jgi:UDP-glucose 4-epimerase
LSSVKVNGEETKDRAHTAVDEPNPQDDYGKSKWLAEQALAQVSSETGLQTAVVRSPLVYGPGVRANFLRLMQWVDRDLPLPLASIHNKRSLVSVWNLCDLLIRTLEHPAASGRTWLVSDGCDLSTPEIIRYIGNAMAKRPRLLPVPVGFLRLAGVLAGRSAEMARLCGSLVVDTSETRRALGWSPPVTVADSLSRTVEWFRSRHTSPFDVAR